MLPLLDFMKDFAAIDFETANGQRTSICSVGIVVVRDGLIAERYEHLVQPTPNYYFRHFSENIHGIYYEDTCEEALFPDVWCDVVPLLGGLPLVAHNKSFDEGCLRAVHKHYGLCYPEYEFYCTLVASRRAFPHLVNHQLHTVSAHCGYDLTNHHHALADAEACAHIAMMVL